MALIVTPAADDADSYLSVAAAESRARVSDDGPERDAWLSTALERQERLLRRATVEIDMYLEPAWDRYSSTQALQFPREVDVTGSTPYIPPNVELATYQQAIYLAKNTRVLAAANVRRERGDGTDVGLSQIDPDAGPSALSPLAILALARYRKVAGATRGSLRSTRVLGGLSVSR